MFSQIFKADFFDEIFKEEIDLEPKKQLNGISNSSNNSDDIENIIFKEEENDKSINSNMFFVPFSLERVNTKIIFSVF